MPDFVWLSSPRHSENVSVENKHATPIVARVSWRKQEDRVKRVHLPIQLHALYEHVPRFGLTPRKTKRETAGNSGWVGPVLQS